MQATNYNYDEVRKIVQMFTETDQLRLLEELATLIRRQMVVRERHSILELQGLGKEIWTGMDAQEYVDEERSSWAG